MNEGVTDDTDEGTQHSGDTVHNSTVLLLITDVGGTAITFVIVFGSSRLC